MTIILDGTTGITTPGLINTGTETVVNLTTSGNTTLGDASGDTLTLNGSTVSTPNGLNFDSNTFVIDATNNRVGVGVASPNYALDVSNTSINEGLRVTTASNGYSDFTNGTITARLQTSGAAFFGTVTNHSLVLNTNNTERMRIDSSGNVGIGTSSPTSYASKFIEVSNATSAGLKLTAGTSGVNLGSSVEYVASDKSLRLVTYEASSLMRFYTVGTEAMRIDSSGNLLVGKTSATANGGDIQVSKGITFPATQSAQSDANTLDDYEEGTFTPTIVGSTTAGTGTYSVQVGRYTKIGDRVFFTVKVTWSAHTGTGNLRIAGLPFTSSLTPDVIAILSVMVSNLTFSNQLSAYVVNSSTQAELRTFATGAASVAVTMDTAAQIEISGHYQVA